MQITFNVPPEARAALIGLNGGKVQDTRRMTNTHIKFSHDQDGSTKVQIRGSDPTMVDRAHKIILLAVNHYEASVTTADISPLPQPDFAEAAMDLMTYD